MQSNICRKQLTHFIQAESGEARFKRGGVEAGSVWDTISFPLLGPRRLADFSSAVELAVQSQYVRPLPVLTAEGEISARGYSTHPAPVTGLI